EFVWRNDQLDRMLRKFPLQLLHTGDGRVIGIAHAKDNLVSRIVLKTVTAKTFVDVRVSTFEWLEDGDGGQGLSGAVRCGVSARACLTLAEEGAGTPQTQQVVDGAGEAAENRYELEDSDGGMNHARAQASLFVSQRLDRIQVRGLPRGIDAEDEPDSGCGAEAERGPEHGHAGRQRGPQHWNHPNHKRPGGYANDAANRSQHDGLESELQQNVSLARPDGFAHADLTRPLGHAYQHNVHHSHAPNNEGHAGNSEHANEQGTSNLVPGIGDGIRGKNCEVVRLVNRNLAPSPQQLANLIDRLRNIIMGGGLDADPVLLKLGMELAQG